jgi:hypothetical protein
MLRHDEVRSQPARSRTPPSTAAKSSTAYSASSSSRRTWRTPRPTRSVCPSGACTKAALPPEPIPKSGIGSGLLAHVIVSKLVDHLPLHRQESILARHGWTYAVDTPITSEVRPTADAVLT